MNLVYSGFQGTHDVYILTQLEKTCGSGLPNPCSSYLSGGGGGSRKPSITRVNNNNIFRLAARVLNIDESLPLMGKMLQIFSHFFRNQIFSGNSNGSKSNMTKIKKTLELSMFLFLK